MKLTCEWGKACPSDVTHVDEKGWIYCTPHGEQRQAGGWRRCRKLTSAEKATLEAGGTILYDKAAS
jgi:hypothetical protein